MICGIQQIGIGVPDFKLAFKWYRKIFGMDIPVFEDEGEPVHMIPYTGGKLQKRHAILAANLQGGSGFEIWQYTSRNPEAPGFSVKLGDLGIFLARIKAYDVYSTFKVFKEKDIDISGEVYLDPAGNEHFFLKDPFETTFQIVKGTNWFAKGRHTTGGACGCMIGVSDIDKARLLYTDILGYDEVIYDEMDIFEDFRHLPGGSERVRRVLLTHSEERKGTFSRWLGSSQIELIQVLTRKPRKIFEGRLWGDLGFIHLCFDVHGMESLEKECRAHGFPFKVDSSDSFSMGEASGQFSYIEDPDGTLIEFVEAHRIPIVKKLNWHLDLKRRDPRKPLPNWMIKLLSLNRIRD